MSNNTYNPFRSAIAQIHTPEAIDWYKVTALECLYCFCEGLVTLMAATFYAGQLAHISLYNWVNTQMGNDISNVLKAGKVEDVIGTGWASYHLIEFAKDCAAGDASASFYSQKLR
jgi:hypothetical protein